MEILVLIMLALFIIVIALLVVIFVNVKKMSVSRRFNRDLENGIDEMEDSFDEDDNNFNLVMPSSVILGLTNEVEVEPIGTKVVEEVVEPKEEVVTSNTMVNEVIEEKNITNEKSQEMAEVVNLLIDKKSYVLLANDNKVSKHDQLKIRVDNKIYYAKVIKGNYVRDISGFKVRPKKLIIVENKAKDDEKMVLQEEIMPIKKRSKEGN